MSQVNGYELFEDVEDYELRCHNRAAVLMNMFDTNGGTPDAIRDGLIYVQAIPQPERQDVISRLAENWNL